MPAGLAVGRRGRGGRYFAAMPPVVVPAIRRFLASTGLFGPAFWAYKAVREWSPALERRNRAVRAAQPPGLPLPPSALVFDVAASRDLSWFVEQGRRSQAGVARYASEAGVDLARASAVLDFGCGCGRVLRHWAGVLPDGVLHGSDYNPRAIQWVREHLRHVTAGLNDLAPPLAYPDATFDFVYALSVFTHLTPGLEAAWLTELTRVTKPGGVMLVTLQGAPYRPKFTADEAAAFDAGEAVVRQGALAGTNWCATFHPPAYVRRVFAARLELLRHDVGAMPGVPEQDVVVLRRPAADGAGGI